MVFKDEYIHQNLEALLYIFMVLNECVHYELVETLCIFMVFNEAYVHHDLKIML